MGNRGTDISNSAGQRAGWSGNTRSCGHKDESLWKTCDNCLLTLTGKTRSKEERKPQKLTITISIELG